MNWARFFTLIGITLFIFGLFVVWEAWAWWATDGGKRYATGMYRDWNDTKVFITAVLLFLGCIVLVSLW